MAVHDENNKKYKDKIWILKMKPIRYIFYKKCQLVHPNDKEKRNTIMSLV